MLDWEGYPMMLIYHLDKKLFYWIKRDGYYPDIERMVNISG